MPKAFVFVNVEVGSESEVLKRLREVPEIKEAYSVYGVYDIVAEVQADSMGHLKETITWKIRGVERIRSTLTTIVVEGK
jgi:DNA-binding Lrp family transcriptional regulator